MSDASRLLDLGGLAVDRAPETFAKMWNSLIDTGDEGVHILQAYVVN